MVGCVHGLAISDPGAATERLRSCHSTEASCDLWMKLCPTEPSPLSNSGLLRCSEFIVRAQEVCECCWDLSRKERDNNNSSASFSLDLKPQRPGI